MHSTITTHGQTVIPAEIRRQFDLTVADRLEWIVENGRTLVIPVRNDPMAAFRGQGKKGSTARLLAERAQDRARE